MSGSKGPGNLDDILDVDASSPNNNDALIYQTSSGKWEPVAGGGGGETNTASNVGTAGVGPFKQKTGVDLEFKNINAADAKITVTNDPVNDEVDIGFGVVDADDLNDITYSTLTHLHLLAWNSIATTWQNTSMSSLGIQTQHTYLDDIAASSAADGNFLVGDGVNYINESGATARASLGLTIGTDVQAYDADLSVIGAIAKTDGNFIVANGSTWVAESGATARASLGLTIGTDVQAYDADLSVLGAIAKTDGNFIVGNGSTWVAESGATARASLGLTIGTDVQAYDNDLADIAALTHTKGNVMVSDGTDWTNLGVGSNDQVLTADSAQTAGVKWADAGGGGNSANQQDPSTAHSVNYVNGNTGSHGQYTTEIMVNDQMVMTPFYMDAARTLSKIAVYCSTAVAGASVRVGVYDNDSVGQPDALVVDGGQMSIGTIGWKEATVTQALTADTWYWLAVTTDTNSGSPRLGELLPDGAPRVTITTGNPTPANSYYESGVDPASSLPANTGTLINSQKAIIFGLRF